MRVHELQVSNVSEYETNRKRWNLMSSILWKKWKLVDFHSNKKRKNEKTKTQIEIRNNFFMKKKVTDHTLPSFETRPAGWMYQAY